MSTKAYSFKTLLVLTLLAGSIGLFIGIFMGAPTAGLNDQDLVQQAPTVISTPTKASSPHTEQNERMQSASVAQSEPVKSIPDTELNLQILRNRPWLSGVGVELAKRLSEGQPYPEVYAYLHNIPTNLSEEELKDLQQFLLLPKETFGEMDNLEALGLWNEALNILIQQDLATDETAEFIASLVLTPDLDPGLRNYALQFVYLLEESSEFSIRTSADTYKSVREEAYQNLESSLAGVAMLGDLRRLKNDSDDQDFSRQLVKELQGAATERLKGADNNFSGSNVSTALNVLIELNDPTVDPWLKRILTASTSPKLGTRLVAIRGVGVRQLDALRPQLQIIMQNEQEYKVLRNAAERTLQNIDKKIHPHGEKNV